MAGRYIPPHLRKKESSNNRASSAEAATTLTPYPTLQPEEGLYTLTEITNHLGLAAEDGKPGTLHASRTDPDALAFILVFAGQHPDFDSRREILCKSNLYLLPHPPPLSSLPANLSDNSADETSGAETKAVPPSPLRAATQTPTTAASVIPTPIPIFLQTHSKTPHTPAWKPLGLHLLASTTYLEPRSARLIELLDRKFKITRPDGREVLKTRRGGNWEASLGMRWAVVRLERKVGGADEEDDDDPMKGCVREERKGVREMMEEMRIRDREGGGSVGLDRADDRCERNEDKVGL
ncbi:MAG: hypothetical protein L6R40_008786 [Gallowayella cf. fulva]|nr:MAG: hypothetical protein L6R40_008786 [Xanthomendoza cf. fulva]